LAQIVEATKRLRGQTLSKRQVKRGLTQSTGGLGTNNFVTILELADLPMVQNRALPRSLPPPAAAGKKTTRSRPISDEGQIETFTIVYVTPDGFLPPLALALVRDRNGGLVMAQGEDTAHLKIGREVYLRRLDDFYLFTVKSQLQKVQESLKRLLQRSVAAAAKEERSSEEKP
jgi:hypothetical protein